MTDFGPESRGVQICFLRLEHWRGWERPEVASESATRSGSF